MPYLVTAVPPPADNGIRVDHSCEFSQFDDDTENLTSAIRHAEDLLHRKHTNVRVWKLQGQPEVITTIKWNGAAEVAVS